ncbi:MAG: hypothetical protein K6C40_11000 [Thermoguttaceae bacterium]|nr:hypothetical protein [Thermoguttaceae bacterium]
MAEKINSRKNIELAEKLLPKIDNYLNEARVDAAEEAWQKADHYIRETYKDKTQLKPSALQTLMSARAKVEKQLKDYRKKIDIGRIQLIIRSGNAEGAMQFLEAAINSSFYSGVDEYYIGNFYYSAGKFFLEEKDYANAQVCFLQSFDFFENSAKNYKETKEKELSKSSLVELQNSLFNLYFLQGNYVEANETLGMILKSEAVMNSDNSERYRKYQEIKENFPFYVLTEHCRNQSAQVAFEQFCNLIQGDYGERLSLQDKINYLIQATTFFEKHSQAELASECEKRQLEIYGTALNEMSFAPEDRAKILNEYNQLMDKILSKAEHNKDFMTVFEFKKMSLDQHKEEFGVSDPRVLMECRSDMDYFFDLGEKATARSFFEELAQIREKTKEEKIPYRNNYTPFSFFLNELSDFALYYNDDDDVLYEPTRQKNEYERRTICAPQGNIDKEFKFWEIYHQFVKKLEKPGEGLSSLADSLFEMIKDPVFQQYEYAQPILKLGLYYYQNKKYQETEFCANLSGDIMSFYASPDAPENFFPIVLRAAVLMDSGNPEMANDEIQNLTTFGILQRMGRLSLMSGSQDDFILNLWPYGKLDPNMNTKSLSLIKSAEKIPDSLFVEKIEYYQPDTNPVPIVIKLANQYEKSEQYTQAMLLFKFLEPFFQGMPEDLMTLKERVNLLEDKRKK